MSLLASVAVLWTAAQVPALTDAGFEAGFSTQVSASGAIDIAQAPDGQFDDPEEPSTLETNGLPIGLTARDGSPGGETAVVSVPVVNLSEETPAELSVVIEPDDGATSRAFGSLRFAVAGDGGEPVPDGATVDGAWFDEHPDGLALADPLPAGETTTLAISVWLAADAPESVRGADTALKITVQGETVAPETPVILDEL